MNCLDKLDCWNAFVNLYDTLNNKNEISNELKWVLKSKKHRYKIIKRKIEKSLSSKKLGNLMHPSQSEFTDQEIEDRAYELMFEITRDIKYKK